MTVHTRGDDLQLFVDLSNIPQPESAAEAPLKDFDPRFHYQRTENRVRHGVLYLPPVLTDRPGDLNDSDVAGNDDDAACDCFHTLQTTAVHFSGRLAIDFQSHR